MSSAPPPRRRPVDLPTVLPAEPARQDDPVSTDTRLQQAWEDFLKQAHLEASHAHRQHREAVLRTQRDEARLHRCSCGSWLYGSTRCLTCQHLRRQRDAACPCGGTYDTHWVCQDCVDQAQALLDLRCRQRSHRLAA